MLIIPFLTHLTVEEKKQQMCELEERQMYGASLSAKTHRGKQRVFLSKQEEIKIADYARTLGSAKAQRKYFEEEKIMVPYTTIQTIKRR